MTYSQTEKNLHTDNHEFTLTGRADFSVPTLSSWLQLGTISISQKFLLKTVAQGTCRWSLLDVGRNFCPLVTPK